MKPIEMYEGGSVIVPKDPNALVTYIGVDGEVQPQDMRLNENGVKGNRCFALSQQTRERILEATSYDEVKERMAKEHPGVPYAFWAEPNFAGITSAQFQADFGNAEDIGEPIESLEGTKGEDVAEAE